MREGLHRVNQVENKQGWIIFKSRVLLGSRRLVAGAHAKKTSQGFSSCYTLFIMSAPLTYLDKLAEGQRVLYISLLQNSICSLKALPKLRRARVVRTVHVLLVCCELHRWIGKWTFKTHCPSMEQKVYVLFLYIHIHLLRCNKWTDYNSSRPLFTCISEISSA